MILADTSVWIKHFKGKEDRLRVLLERGDVLIHPFVTGELACGNLRDRDLVLSMLDNLPRAITAGDEEVLTFIRIRSLPGKGLGYIDAHLLASTALTPDARLWTEDRRLKETAEEMGLGAAEQLNL